MPADLSKWGPATVLVVLITAIVVIVGGLVVVINPDTLTFGEYVDALKQLIIGVGLLGIGRGITHATRRPAVEDQPR